MFTFECLAPTFPFHLDILVRYLATDIVIKVFWAKTSEWRCYNFYTIPWHICLRIGWNSEEEELLGDTSWEGTFRKFNMTTLFSCSCAG